MNDKARKRLKFIGQMATTAVLSVVSTAIIFYAVNGWQISGDLRYAVEKDRVASVTVSQNGESLTTDDPEQMKLAAGCALILRVNLPGRETNLMPDTEYIFEFKNGKTVQIGTVGDTVIKDGKAYSPKGAGGCVLTFYNCTEGLFFLDKAQK